MKAAILVVDRRCILGECLSEFLSRNLGDTQVISVGTAQHAVQLTYLPVVCVIVSDVDDVPTIRKSFPSVAFVVIRDGRGIEPATSDGLLPAVMLDMPKQAFLEVVRSAAQRGSAGALSAKPHEMDAPDETDKSHSLVTSESSIALTDRERDVLKALQRGLPNKLIADELDLSENTVKIHVRNVMRKLGVTNRTMAALRTVADGAQKPAPSLMQ